MSTTTEGFTKPSITRLARRAGVKSLSDDCVATIKNLIGIKLNEVLRVTSVVNEQNNTKTIMPDDVYQALEFLNTRVARSDEL